MLPVTTLLASIAAVALVALSIAVSLKRLKAGVRIGVGEDPGLLRRIRAQGNFIEYVPMALILCGLAELRGVGAGWLWTLAALLVFGRSAHVIGILTGSTPVRASGMVATYSALLAGVAALMFA